MASQMQDLEEQMEEIKMLMNLWNNFYRILTLAFEAEEEQVKSADPEFQKIKTVVAEHHDRFMTVIKKDKHIGQSILTTVKRTINLTGFNDLSEVERNKTLIDWHDANILLNETLGSLECDRDRILRKRTLIPVETTGKKIMRFLTGPTAKNLITFIVLIVIILVVYLNWEAISSSPFYQKYVKQLVDQAASLLGLGEAAPE